MTTMEVETVASLAVGESLVDALEQAALMAKQIPAAGDPARLLQIHAALFSAHRHLSLFLTRHHHPPPLPVHDLMEACPPSPQPENSVSSAMDGGVDETGGGEPMQIGDDEENEHNSRATTSGAAIDKVEERMKECFIQNKRPKRQLSPSTATAAERRRLYGNVYDKCGSGSSEFNPLGTRLRSIDLIFQFHA